LLVDSSGSVDGEATRTIKKRVFDKPYIKKSASIGAKDFPKDFYSEIESFARRGMPIFDSRREAVAWLVQDLRIFKE